MQQAQTFADDLGIYDVSGYASALLEGEEQSQLIKAVISNDEYAAKALLERGKAALHELSATSDIVFLDQQPYGQLTNLSQGWSNYDTLLYL